MKNKIIKQGLIAWEKCEWFQPKDFKKYSKSQMNKLKTSLKNNGFLSPFLVWETKTGKVFILDAHHRQKAMEELKEEGVAIPLKLPAVWIDCKNKSEAKKALLVYNSSYADIDQDIFADWIDGFDMDKLMEEIEIPDIDFSSLFEREITMDDDDMPENVKSITKTGDLWGLGRHRVLCGDSTKIEDVEKLMDGNKADMVFTDPPYGLGGYKGRGKDTKRAVKNDDINPKQFYECIPEAPEVYVWGCFKNINDINFEPRDVIVWRKNNFGMGRGYRGQYEICFYAGGFSGSDSDVWDVSRDINYKHPTQKPVALCERAINNSKPRNIIDLYLGSGSTLIACEKTNRVCYGIEPDKTYVSVIIKRWINWMISNGKEKEIKIKKNGKSVSYKSYL